MRVASLRLPLLAALLVCASTALLLSDATGVDDAPRYCPMAAVHLNGRPLPPVHSTSATAHRFVVFLSPQELESAQLEIDALVSVSAAIEHEPSNALVQLRYAASGSAGLLTRMEDVKAGEHSSIDAGRLGLAFHAAIPRPNALTLNVVGGRCSLQPITYSIVLMPTPAEGQEMPPIEWPEEEGEWGEGEQPDQPPAEQPDQPPEPDTPPPQEELPECRVKAMSFGPGISMSPEYFKHHFAYTCLAEPGVFLTTLTARTKGAVWLSLRVNGGAPMPLQSEVESPSWQLQPGENVVQLTVAGEGCESTYTVHCTRPAPADPAPLYNWGSTAFESCNAVCAPGQWNGVVSGSIERSVGCFSDAGDHVDDAYCAATPKPDSERPCYTDCALYPGPDVPPPTEPETPSGPGHETPSGPGEETPSGPGQETPSGPGEEMPSGPGEEMPSGPGQETPSGPGEETPSGPGEEMPSGPDVPPNPETPSGPDVPPTDPQTPTNPEEPTNPETPSPETPLPEEPTNPDTPVDPNMPVDPNTPVEETPAPTDPTVPDSGNDEGSDPVEQIPVETPPADSGPLIPGGGGGDGELEPEPSTDDSSLNVEGANGATAHGASSSLLALAVAALALVMAQ